MYSQIVKSRLVWRLVQTLLVLGFFSSLVSACSQKQVNFHSVDITGASYARHFSLPDATGVRRTLVDFSGSVVVVFFGFTQCPDVCPGTMAELSSVKKTLEKNKAGSGKQLQVVFITLDPQRDTADVLKTYAANFDPAFIALRPNNEEELAALAKEFKIFYKKTAGTTPGSYSMDHTAASYIFDPKGRVRLFTRYGLGLDQLTSDIEQLLAGR